MKDGLVQTHLDLSRLPEVASSWAKALAGAAPEAALPESASYQLLGLLKVPLNTIPTGQTPIRAAVAHDSHAALAHAAVVGTVLHLE